MDNKALALTILHVIAIITAVLTAIAGVGPTVIANLFSHNAGLLSGSVIALLVAVASAIGAGGSGSFLKPK